MINMLSIEQNPIKTLDIYIPTTTYHIFSAKIIENSLKVLTTSIAVKVHHTDHPFHTLGSLPFAIINDTQSIGQERLEKLIASIIGMDGEGGTHKEIAIVSGMWNVCKQLCMVSSVFADKDINPYWMFLSPYFKYKAHRQLTKMKEQLITRTDYLQSDGELHIDNVLIKLSTVATLYSTLPLTTYPLQIQYFIHIIIQAMLAHFRQNNTSIYEAAKADARFSGVTEKAIQIQTKIREQGRLNNRIVLYANIELKLDEPNKNNIDAESYHQKIGRTLFKPVYTTGIFMLIYILFA